MSWDIGKLDEYVKYWDASETTKDDIEIEIKIKRSWSLKSRLTGAKHQTSIPMVSENWQRALQFVIRAQMLLHFAKVCGVGCVCRC